MSEAERALTLARDLVSGCDDLAATQRCEAMIADLQQQVRSLQREKAEYWRKVSDQKAGLVGLHVDPLNMDALGGDLAGRERKPGWRDAPARSRGGERDPGPRRPR
jgi:hypothetical protein